MVATITLESTNGDSVVVSGARSKWDAANYIDDDIVLDVDPQGMYDTAFTLRTQSGAFENGGRVVGIEVPIREPILPFWLTPETRPRFQRLWGTPGNFHKVKATWDSPNQDESGPRWLWLRLAKEIVYTTEDGFDADIDDIYHAVVSTLALNPNYESAENVQEWTGPGTGWFEVWNPTDQPLWLEWTFDPAEEWRFPDFGFGQERKWRRPVGSDAARMIITPELTQMLSVMVDPMMDTYVNADLSNAAALFGGVEPVYAVPPYTGTEDDPVLLPVQCSTEGAKVTLRQRRFWSAESGLELPPGSGL